MKRILAVFALLVLASQVEAQNRVALPLTGWRYQNFASYGTTTSDTLSGTTADTVFIGVLGAGNLYPKTVSFAVKLTNTTGDCDTVAVYWDRGQGGLYQTDTAPDTLIKAITTTATVVRTLNTDATLNLSNAQALANNKAGFTGLRCRIVGISVPATARVKYEIKAFGEYERQ